MLKNNILCIGDTIEFDFFGQYKKGIIEQVGKYGYWIKDTVGCVGIRSIRCPFNKAILVKNKDNYYGY